MRSRLGVYLRVSALALAACAVIHSVFGQAFDAVALWLAFATSAAASEALLREPRDWDKDEPGSM